ncbi:hypothetical protein C8J57DRAFT_1055531, partial [Mycena rebaudengoi]
GGPDSAGARDMITAILEVEFSSDAEQSRALRERWNSTPREQTSLTIGTTAENDVHLPISFLDQFAAPLQITEVTPAADPAILHAADVTVLVSSLEELQKMSITRPHSLVVVNIDIPAEGPQPRASSSRSTLTPRYFFVSPSEALAAKKDLNEKYVGTQSDRLEAVNRYSERFLASRITTLITYLRDIFSSLGDVSALRNRSALSQIHGALVACGAAIQDAKAELDGLSAEISDLESLVEEERAKVRLTVFGPPEEDVVEQAVKAARDIMKLKMDHFTWRAMVWNVDDLSTYITALMQRVWCRELELELMAHSGRLSGVQRTLTGSAFAVLASADKTRLHSAVLHNTLSQLADTPSFPVAPGELAAPICARSALIANNSTLQLHRMAQRSLVGTGAATFLGVGLSWAGWVTELLGNGAFVEPAVVVPSGILCVLAGVHWGGWQWARAKKDWWSGWNRVADGLKQDLSDTLDRIVEDKVVVVPKTACLELSKLVGSRRLELDRLQDDLDKLASVVKRLEQR